MTDAAAERAVVGAALLRPDIVGWLDMDAGRFHDPKHRYVWRAMERIHERGEAIDIVTLGAELTAQGKLDAIGGLAYLSELALAVPTADNVEFYANIVREWAITREVLLALSYGREQFDMQGALGHDLLDECVAVLSRIERPVGNREITLAQAAKDEIAAIREDLRVLDEGGTVWVGMPTGIAKLDAETGGIPLAKLTILGARPGEGKSTTLMQILLNVVNTGRGAILFSYEDRADVWARKALGCVAGVTTRRIRDRVKLTPNDMAALDAADQQMEEVWSRFKIIAAHGMRMQEVVRIIRGLRRRLDVGIVAIDYIQNVPAPYPERKDKRTYEIQDSLTLLEQVVSEEELAAIVVSQLKRPPQDRSGKRKEDPRPTINDLKDSGALEQKGKLILALRRTEEMERYNQLGIGILKFNEGKNYIEVVPTFDVERSRVY